MGWKTEVSNAKAKTQAVWPIPGVFDVQVLKVKETKKRPPKGRPQEEGDDLFIVELKVLNSSNPDRPAGSTMDWVVNMSYDSSPANVKAFLMVAAECSEDELTEEAISAITGPDQPLCGVQVHVDFFNVKTKKGGDFTVGKWAPIGSKAA